MLCAFYEQGYRLQLTDNWITVISRVLSLRLLLVVLVVAGFAPVLRRDDGCVCAADVKEASLHT